MHHDPDAASRLVDLRHPVGLSDLDDVSEARRLRRRAHLRHPLPPKTRGHGHVGRREVRITLGESHGEWWGQHGGLRSLVHFEARAYSA